MFLFNWSYALTPRGQRQLENAMRERELRSCFDFSGIFLTSEVGARGLMNLEKKHYVSSKLGKLDAV